ncbi:hypothetical protein AOL_s00188g268 [Orbilia oligospora ATCC 24927]|uniref:Uncharacterized protein n=2 Tax=Orbilia oligospora TaxID=2813651 RepID=G1XQQ6_ARTOA|nr:hypothetical protein AOL_s00188g268 [Orbilia oligospora ATCC 24927]EGX44600.1 hypothetical protein AOL_s00188g268 [Orbilia oligospora ATCC 24927]KAF3280487.1 hypothetical protein TWF970_002708 [Orbilia oligospora]
MPRSPTCSPIFEFPTEMATSLVIPKISIRTHSEIKSQALSPRINLKSPLTTKSKSRTGIPIIIGTNCDTRSSELGATGQSGDKSSRDPTLRESDNSYFDVSAEPDDEDYVVDEYSHAGQKSTETVVYSKSLSTPHSPESSISSQPSLAEQCLMQKEFRVEVREYDAEKAEGSEQNDGSESDQGCCGCFGWLAAFWKRGT